VSSRPVWINGSLTGSIDPRDRGFLLGDGVFDTLVAFARRPFAGDRHLQRLGEHATAIGLAFDANHIRTAWDVVLSASPSDHTVLRTTVTRGVTARDLWPAIATEPTIVVSASPWDSSLAGRAIRLVTSTVRRNADSPTSRLKTIGYLDNILAAREVVAAGADDALLLGRDGHVACTTIANIFVLTGNRLLTPPSEDGVLPGITRQLVLEKAEALGFEAREQSLRIADLEAATGIFATNSVRLARPVVALDGRPLPADADGGIDRIAAAVAEMIEVECATNPRTAG